MTEPPSPRSPSVPRRSRIQLPVTSTYVSLMSTLTLLAVLFDWHVTF